MPVVGNRRSANADLAKGYRNDPMARFAQSFLDTAKNILSEGSVDVFANPARVMQYDLSNETMQNFFMENSMYEYDGITPEEIDEHMEEMHEQYLNDRDAVLEYAPLNAFNPVIGMTFPIHKNILMNCIFDKGAIQKFVAKEPKFTISMETRMMVDTQGNEFDIWKEQYKIHDAIKNTVPFVEVPLTLPESEQTNILGRLSSSFIDDNLSLDTYVSGAEVESYVANGEKYRAIEIVDGTEVVVDKVATADGVQKVVMPVRKEFHPGYGEYDRQIMDSIVLEVFTAANTKKVVKTTISGYMKKNRFALSSSNMTDIPRVVLSARLDASSAMLRTCTMKWSVRTDPVEIGDAIPINIPISPDEVKDIGALYQINQLTKIMSMMKLALGNYKDDEILLKLDESYRTMSDDSKLARTFDFAVREGYMGDHIEWRYKTFMDQLDTWATHLIHVLNDPNMTITVFGRDDLIRKMSPTEYTYQTPTTIGAVEMDFVKTVVSSDKRTFQFISSDKLRNSNQLIIILNPKNTERIIYRLYDYQMFVSNEIRNAVNYALTGIHAFERWKFLEYQPVQARVKILNPTGLRTRVENKDPIGDRIYRNDPEVEYETTTTVDETVGVLK